MGLFSEDKKSECNKYNSIVFPSSINEITENDPNKLIEQIKEEVEILKKIKLSEKLAKCTGVPGLLSYIEVSYVLLEQEKETGLLIQQAGLESLSYLMLAKLIYESDSDAKKMMKRFMPEEKIDIDYWDNKKNKIIELADLKGFEKQAEQTSEQLYALIFPASNKSAGYAKN